jgi:hypothetical protein
MNLKAQTKKQLDDIAIITIPKLRLTKKPKIAKFFETGSKGELMF